MHDNANWIIFFNFYSHCVLTPICYLFTVFILCLMFDFFMHNFFRNLVIFCMYFKVPFIWESFLASWMFSESVICLYIHFELFFVSIVVNRRLHSNTAVALTFRTRISPHFYATNIWNSAKKVIDFHKLTVKVPKSTSPSATWSGWSWSSKLISSTFTINCTLDIVWIYLEWIGSILIQAWGIANRAYLFLGLELVRSIPCIGNTMFEPTASQRLLHCILL